MLLSDVYAKLSHHELSNLSISGEGSGTITDAAKPKVLGYVNEALLRLYSRFILKENDVLIQLYREITFYQLTPRFALTFQASTPEDDEPVRYIIDLKGEPFKDEVLKVISVYDSNGCKLPLNNETEPYSVFTPSPKTLQVPNPVQDCYLDVRYQQRHTELQGDLSETIDCPDVLVKALTSHIAYQTFSHMNSPISSGKAQEFLATYEAICNEVVDRDLVSSSTSQTNTRFERGGWL